MSEKALGIAGSIVSILGGLFGIGKAIFEKGVKIPEPPKFTIPEADMRNLTQQIQANTAISEQARALITANLQAYNQGILTEAYANVYNDYARKLLQDALRTINERASAQGFTPASTQYQELYRTVMADVNARLAELRVNLLEKQLDDALKSAGLAETTINDLKTKWTMETEKYGMDIEKWKGETEAKLWRRYLQEEKMGKLGPSLEALTKGLEGLGEALPAKTPVTLSPEAPKLGEPLLGKDIGVEFGQWLSKKGYTGPEWTKWLREGM